MKLTIKLKNIYYTKFIENIVPYNNLYNFLIICKQHNINVVILTNNTLDIQLQIFKKLKLNAY